MSYTEENTKVNYNKTLSETPLTFEITGDGDIVWRLFSQPSDVTSTKISYSLDNGKTYQDISPRYGDDVERITVTSGDTVMFKAPNDITYNTLYDNEASACFCGTTCEFMAKGNPYSLLDGENFNSITKLTGSRAFYHLFQGCTGLTDVSELVLPAIELGEYIYCEMFKDCTNITSAPELPATKLADSCYRAMFFNCTSLTTAPELPATTLETNCYKNMFYNCTSLTTAPKLPATILADECYNSMFRSCTNLTKAPELPATTLAMGCYNRMFGGCTSLTTAPSSIGTTATTMATSACTYMFMGCTSLTTAPELPATTLANLCYRDMFHGCTSLTTAPELPATTLETNCYTYMFVNCSKLNYIRCLATDISASLCTVGWVNGVSSAGTFVKNPSMTSWPTGAYGIPAGWTVQDA